MIIVNFKPVHSEEADQLIPTLWMHGLFIERIGMRSATIEVNGRQVTCYEDGSVEWRHGGRGKLRRTFGFRSGNGYRQFSISGKKFYMHRVIASVFIGALCGLEVDHVNGDKADNRHQ